MNHNDFVIVGGGLSAPMWLPTLNEWVALCVGLMSIAYLGAKLYQLWKDKNDG